MEPNGKLTFFCPHCGQKLSFLNGTIIKMTGRLFGPKFSCKTMLYIPAKLGQYGAIVGEGVRMQEGAKVEFECINGACKRNFTADYDDNLAEIKMIDSEGHEYAVVFNKVFGRRSTFLVSMTEKKLIGSYGEHANEHSLDFEKPINFFGA